MATLNSLFEIRSQTAKSQLVYLKVVEDHVDAPHKKPVYLGTRLPSTLYIEPYVLKSVPKAKTGRDDEEQSGRQLAAEKKALRDNALEIGEQSISRAAEVETRVKWSDERREMLSSDRRSAVIIGPPGQGKSQLAAMTAAMLARESWKAVDQRLLPLSEISLPVLLTFKELTSCHAEAGETLDQMLRRALVEAVQRKTEKVISRATAYLSMNAHESRTWIFLDALDELPDDRQKIMTDFWSVFAGWQCRIVITSRPHAYKAHPVPSALARIYPPLLSKNDPGILI